MDITKINQEVYQAGDKTFSDPDDAVKYVLRQTFGIEVAQWFRNHSNISAHDSRQAAKALLENGLDAYVLIHEVAEEYNRLMTLLETL